MIRAVTARCSHERLNHITIITALGESSDPRLVGWTRFITINITHDS
jgi:hypothetical protein